MCRKLVGPDFVQYRDLTAHNDFDMEFLEALAQALVDTKRDRLDCIIIKDDDLEILFQDSILLPLSTRRYSRNIS